MAERANPRSFKRALEEADEVLEGVPVPGSLRDRIDASLETRPRAWRAALWPAAALAAAAIVLVVVRGGEPEPTPEPEAPAASVLAMQVVERSEDFAFEAAGDRGEVRVASGSAVLKDALAGARVRVSAPARLVRVEDRGALRALAGRLEVEVDKRDPSAAPWALWVSHGRIEVLGTRFTVIQGEGSGEVRLHEGAIRFVPSAGEPVALAPGDRLRWPLRPPAEPEPAKPPAATTPTEGRTAVAPAPPVAPVAPEDPEPKPKPAPRPKTRPEPAADPAAEPTTEPPGTELDAPEPAPEPKPETAEALLHRVATLRSRGRFGEAVGALREGLRRPFGASVKARLSFELGSLLTWQLGDTERACAHWARHRLHYGAGRYGEDIAAALRRLGNCPSPPKGDSP